MIRLNDLRLRAFLVALVPLVALPLAVAVWLAEVRMDESEAALRERGVTLARQVAASSEFGVFAENREPLQRLADTVVRDADVTGVAIRARSGEVLAAAGRIGSPAPGLAALPGLADAGANAYVFTAPVTLLPAVVDDPLASEFTRTLRQIDRVIGDVIVELGREPLLEARAAALRIASVVALIGMVAAALVAALIARGVTQPVRRLADTVARIGAGDREARAPVDEARPIGELARGVNEMAARIAAAQAELEARVQAATAELQRQKEDAEEANRVKTQFLAAASHDLRQPLQALGLFVMSLKLEAEGERIGPMITRIENALEAVQNVLEALLDISRLDAGIVTPRVDRFAIGPLLERVADQQRGAADRYGLRVRVMPTALWVESDRGLLERIVANLVSNAVRYTEAGGVVIGCRRVAGGVRIDVVDTGPGIPAARQADVFREFVQLSEARVARDKGLGLGLAIVQRLCRLLGHALDLRSVPGRGTRFSITVPRTAPAPSAPSAPAPTIHGRSLANRLILVVDDDAAIRQALVELLDRYGASTLAAPDRDEALRLVDEIGLPPDFILSDYRLADGAEGIDVVAALRARHGSTIPAAILTGDVAPRVLRRVREAGLVLFSKPVRAEDLVRHLVEQVGAVRRQGSDAGGRS